MRVVRRVLVVLLVVVLVAGVAGLAWGWRTARRSFPQLAGEVTVPGLHGPVEVLRDEHGVPHLFADDAHDLLFAEGYVHAQDRFFEMDTRRHITAGRLSELFGDGQLDTDRFIRTLGWRRVAEAELALLDDETLAALDAYAAGVNAYVADRHTSDLSFEYAVVGLQSSGYTVEPWTAADSLAWLKAMAWDLRGNVTDEIERALLADAVGVERTESLYPDYPRPGDPTIVTGAVVDGAFVPAAGVAAATARTPAPAPLPPDATAALRGVRDAAAALPVLLGRNGAGIGSNSWVVSGDRTASGLPLLADDPHLGPALPSIWYQVGLHCRTVTPACPFDVVGFSFSGVPGVVIGHNAHIAWGFTNLGPDVADLVVERLDGDRYEVDGDWRDLEIRTETIAVAGGDPVEHTIRSTVHGPLLSDVSE